MPIRSDTQLPYVWRHVSNPSGEPHKATLSFNDLEDHGRPVPHCPLRLKGGQGFRYSLEFMEAFAANVCDSLTYEGIMYDGPVPQIVRDVPLGGVDLLDENVYWRFPGGVVRCLSVRALDAISATDLKVSETEADYQRIALQLGYEYLGGGCDVTELLAAPGVLKDGGWRSLPWCLPESSLSPCWWLTNRSGSDEDAPKYLNRSLAVLRAELSRSHVATLAKISVEFRRRQDKNEAARSRLETSPRWSMTAQPLQQRMLAQPTSGVLDELRFWCTFMRKQDPESVVFNSDLYAELEFQWDEVASLVGAVLSEDAGDVRDECFPQTPWELFREMVAAWRARAQREAATFAWSCKRLDAVAFAPVGDDATDEFGDGHVRFYG